MAIFPPYFPRLSYFCPYQFVWIGEKWVKVERKLINSRKKTHFFVQSFPFVCILKLYASCTVSITLIPLKCKFVAAMRVFAHVFARAIEMSGGLSVNVHAPDRARQ